MTSDHSIHTLWLLVALGLGLVALVANRIARRITRRKGGDVIA